MSSLERAIIKTVSYFDIFDYPLTDWEIYQWLYFSDKKTDVFNEQCDYVSVKEILLVNKQLSRLLEVRHGFYCLKGRQSIINTRQKRYVINLKKIKKILTVVRGLSWLPYVRLIGVCNNLAFFNSKKQADFDIFIITAAKKLPIVRLLAILISIIFFKRPTIKSQEDTVCLSFLVDETSGNIEHYAISGTDIYLIYWLATFQPVYIYDDLEYTKWLQENEVLLQHVSNHISRETGIMRISTNKPLKNILEGFFNILMPAFIVYFIYSLQIKYLPQNITKKMNQTSSVVVNPKVFKTHINDKRYEFRNQWSDNCNKLLDRSAC